MMLQDEFCPEIVDEPPKIVDNPSKNFDKTSVWFKFSLIKLIASFALLVWELNFNIVAGRRRVIRKYVGDLEISRVLNF